MHRLTGTIEAIRLENLAKKRGLWSYNVDLTVRVSAVGPAPEAWSMAAVPPPKSVTLRVRHSLPWASLGPEEQAALAPEGPKGVLEVARFRGFAVGEGVDCTVRFTSFALAHLVGVGAG